MQTGSFPRVDFVLQPASFMLPIAIGANNVDKTHLMGTISIRIRSLLVAGCTAEGSVKSVTRSDFP